MIKGLDSIYEAGNRSLVWFKFKKDYLDSSMSDTVDLVPIAAYHGIGKRHGWYGAFLLACWNEENEEW